MEISVVAFFNNTDGRQKMSMRKKPTEYIEMNPAQFAEMQQFYRKLGYNEKQVKVLCSACFGASIKVKDTVAYDKRWDFNRRDEVPKQSLFQTMFGSLSPGHMGARQPQSFMPMAAPMMRASAMPLSDGMMMCEPQELNTYNSAETHAAGEVEEATPMERAQMIFSANVNTASWTYLRDKIMNGERVDSSFVRIEEILNSCSYRLPAPEQEPFSIHTEHGKCPWNTQNELMMVGIKARKAEQNVRQNLALLVDVSGSMITRWVLVQMSLAAVMSGLKEGDYLSVISYSNDTNTVVNKMPCGNRDDYVKAIMSIKGIGGCTMGSKGLENAYTYLQEHFDPKGNNRVYIFTDGDFNFGITSEGGLAEYIRTKRETGIYLSVVGYGRENFKDNKMEALARNGNGNYTFVTNPADILEQLSQKLVSNLVTVAKDVKISVELNPRYVRSYRLIGYDARTLTQAEFHDTNKAVDGIGSEHNVVALIEWQRGEAESAYPSRYVKAQSQGNPDELGFIEIHYKTPEGTDSVMTKTISVDEMKGQTGENMPMLTLLAAFGLLLRNSRYKGECSMEMLRKLMDTVKPQTNEDNPYSHIAVIEKYLSATGHRW